MRSIQLFNGLITSACFFTNSSNLYLWVISICFRLFHFSLAKISKICIMCNFLLFFFLKSLHSPQQSSTKGNNSNRDDRIPILSISFSQSRNSDLPVYLANRLFLPLQGVGGLSFRGWGGSFLVGVRTYLRLAGSDQQKNCYKE